MSNLNNEKVIHIIVIQRLKNEYHYSSISYDFVRSIKVRYR